MTNATNNTNETQADREWRLRLEAGAKRRATQAAESDRRVQARKGALPRAPLATRASMLADLEGAPAADGYVNDEDGCWADEGDGYGGY